MPRDDSHLLRDKLLVLTLALEESLRYERLDEVASLLNERHEVLSEFESHGRCGKAEVSAIVEVERRIGLLISAMQAATVRDLRNAGLGQQAMRAYDQKTSPAQPASLA